MKYKHMKEFLRVNITGTSPAERAARRRGVPLAFVLAEVAVAIPPSDVPPLLAERLAAAVEQHFSAEDPSSTSACDASRDDY